MQGAQIGAGGLSSPWPFILTTAAMDKTRPHGKKANKEQLEKRSGFTYVNRRRKMDVAAQNIWMETTGLQPMTHNPTT